MQDSTWEVPYDQEGLSPRRAGRAEGGEEKERAAFPSA
jgi:hypothetical protein